ncbi:DUF881 domain-containing protein [uncultured Cellulomonas sp.]|uniref:DUF881 domain-containing protein n=1 Tax=uncultured Cellulomonas sp. TaxID=189682 RepID=UPI0028E574B6|nr:DUF881 domain-containing protein [uncultured Cellulomonas sp.]
MHQPQDDREESTPVSSEAAGPVPDARGEPNSLPPVVPEDPDPLPPEEPDDATPVEPAEPDVVPAAKPADLDPDPPVDQDPPDESRSAPTDTVEDDDPADLEQPPAHEPAAPAVPPSGWAMLGRALTPRANRAQLVAGLLCAVLGFALVAQVRQSGEADLGGMRQGDLVRILDETTNRGDALARESADLARERDDLLSGSDRRQAALDALRRQAETQGILTGRLPAEGPGVVVTLTEPEGYIKPITMLNMLEEMRNAGAEAIQLNDQRVTASSAFTGSGGAVVLDGVELVSPYRWIAIGDPDIIAPALQIPGGAMAQVRNNGGKGTVEPADELVVDAIRVVPDPVYATPVPPQGD